MNVKKTGSSIRKKLLFSYFSIVALILVVGIIGILNNQRVYLNGDAIYDSNLKSVEYLKSINQNVKEIDQCVISMMSELDKEYHKTYLDTIERLQEENQELTKDYSGIDVSVLEKRRYNQCRLSFLTFDKQIDSIVELLESGDKQEALLQYKQELMPVKACTYELIEAIVDLSTDSAKSKNQENYQVYQNLVWVSCLVMIFAIVVAVVVTISMSNSFTGKLGKIRQLAQRISEYNISDDIEEMGKDEFGETMAALNESQFMMRNLLEKIIEESATIGDMGDEVAQAVRKSNLKIEAVNVDTYKAEDMTSEMERMLKESLENRSLDAETVALLQDVIRQCQSSMENLQEVQSELTGIATYLEQIGITADYQNQIANSHREQVKKFKV